MRRFIPYFLGFLALITFGPACAASTVHIEWMRGGVVYAAEDLTSTGASVQSGAAPDFGGQLAVGQARVTVLSGAMIVAQPASSPTATQANGLRLEVGATPLVLPVTSGQKLAGIEATDGPSTPGCITPVGYQQITSLSAAATLTVPTGARCALIVPEAAAVRFRLDGTAPTATVGTPLAIGQPVTLNGPAALAAAQFIQQAAGGIINVSFSK